MTYKRNFFVTNQTSVTISITLCTASTNTMAATAYPVFSSQTTDNDGTVYGIDYPLKKLTPATATISATTLPSTNNTSAGTFVALFTNASTYDQSVAEQEGNASRYKYFAYQSSYATNLPTVYSFALTANTNMFLAGTIDFLFGTTTPTLVGDKSTNVCTVTVSGVPVSGGFS